MHTLYPFFSITLTLCLTSHTSALCFYPNGSPSEDTACSTEADVTFCCAIGFACLSNRLCRGLPEPWSMTPWPLGRGSCTDATWSNSTCPTFCQTNNAGNGYQVSQCSNTTYCCGGDASCCTQTLSIISLGTYSTLGIVMPGGFTAVSSSVTSLQSTDTNSQSTVTMLQSPITSLQAPVTISQSSATDSQSTLASSQTSITATANDTSRSTILSTSSQSEPQTTRLTPAPALPTATTPTTSAVFSISKIGAGVGLTAGIAITIVGSIALFIHRRGSSKARNETAPLPQRSATSEDARSPWFKSELSGQALVELEAWSKLPAELATVERGHELPVARD